MNSHSCPICKIELKPVPRYPNYVCETCASKATDETGRYLNFYNEDFSGGFKAVYADSQETYTSHFCFIQGIKCYADESRFGGILIQKME